MATFNDFRNSFPESSNEKGDLQLLDSSTMEEAIDRCTEQDIPVLPVHDELVCPVDSKGAVQQILIDSFHAVTQGKFSSHTPKMTWSEK